MTERKPPGIGFQTWVERQIREAMERGEFDNLPGAGKPIADLDKPHDELWWIKQKLRREINRKILDGNRKAASGPPLNLMPFDVDRVVGDWRRRRKPPPGGPTSAPAP
jgi:hypothetical protein